MTFEQVQARMQEIKQEVELLTMIGATFTPEPAPDYEVVWSGGELLPERETQDDDRLHFVPSYDLDDGQAAPKQVRRRYNLTGKYAKRRDNDGLTGSGNSGSNQEG